MSKKNLLVWSIVSFGIILCGILVLYQKTEKPREIKQALAAYESFVSGTSDIGPYDIEEMATPTGEPDRRYWTGYTTIDANGDGMPELFIKTAREFRVFSYKEGEAYLLYSYFSHPTQCNVLENGGLIRWGDMSVIEGVEYWYYYFELPDEPEKVVNNSEVPTPEVNKVPFSWIDTNSNGICEEEDKYEYKGEKCTLKEWRERTRAFLYTDAEGRERMPAGVEWTVYCEAR